MTATATATPQELREQAAAHDRKAHESFERCDTDGFMSQWADGLTAGKLRLQAQIAENGGRATHPALFDLEGNLVPAKLVDGRYGLVWGLLEDDDPHGRFVGWFNPSQARRPGVARRNDAKKGYYIGYVLAPAEAKLRGGNACTVMPVAVRTDGGFSRDVEIVDNGRGETDLNKWYDVHCDG